MNSHYQRDVFIDLIYEEAKKDKNIFFISADFGAPSLDKFRENLPDQFIHSGISEQHMIDLAAGLSLSGHKVYVYAMAPFITLRCLEQIKCSLAIMSLPVTIISVGVGIGYADSGPTHYTNEDIACTRSIVGLDVYTCSDKYSTEHIAKMTIHNPKLRIIRLDRHPLKQIYYENEEFNEDFFKKVRDGKNICILSYGKMMHKIIEVHDILKSEELEFSLFDIFAIKPFPKKLLNDLKNYNKIITVEEQTLAGGFGSLVLEELAKKKLFNVEVINMGLKDKYYFENGGRDFLLNNNGLSQEDIIRNIKN